MNKNGIIFVKEFFPIIRQYRKGNIDSRLLLFYKNQYDSFYGESKEILKNVVRGFLNEIKSLGGGNLNA